MTNERPPCINIYAIVNHFQTINDSRVWFATTYRMLSSLFFSDILIGQPILFRIKVSC